MEHLLSVWPEIAANLRKARRILLFSDYDGTLTPIVSRPELAILSEDVRQILRELAQEHRITLGILSGRALADIKQKVAIPGIIYAGNHGLEIEGPGISFINPLAEEVKPVIRVLHRILSLSLNTVKGVIVENKGLTLSVHYRQVEKKRAEEVKNGFERAVGGLRAAGNIKTTQGKEVLEVRPAVSWDKGKAIKLLMKRYGKGGRRSGLLPIYLGDDLTDEDGFKFIESYGNGISVFVGEKRRDTTAHYFLTSPEEVRIFLRMLLEFTREGLRSVEKPGVGMTSVKGTDIYQHKKLSAWGPVPWKFVAGWRSMLK